MSKLIEEVVHLKSLYEAMLTHLTIPKKLLSSKLKDYKNVHSEISTTLSSLKEYESIHNRLTSEQILSLDVYTQSFQEYDKQITIIYASLNQKYAECINVECQILDNLTLLDLTDPMTGEHFEIEELTLVNEDGTNLMHTIKNQIAATHSVLEKNTSETCLLSVTFNEVCQDLKKELDQEKSFLDSIESSTSPKREF